MSLRFSGGLRNFLNEGGSLKQAFANSVLRLYSGAQPATADDAVSGTLLAVITLASGAWTASVQAVGSVDLTGGGAGSVDTITVNGLSILPAAVPFNTSLALTAADVITAINDNPKNQSFKAVLGGTARIDIVAKPGLGTLPNGWVVVSAATTITTSDVNMAGGVDAVNGLLLGDSVAGVIPKKPSQQWSGLGLVNGVVGWFRLFGAVADAGTADSAELFHRIDGAVATSGAQLNTTNTNIALGATQTVGTFNVTLPANQ